MTTNTEWKATYHNSDPNTEYDLGDHCYDCGESTRYDNAKLGGAWEIHTNEGKLVTVDGWWCEACQLKACDIHNGTETHAQALAEYKKGAPSVKLPIGCYYCEDCCDKLEQEAAQSST